MKIIAINNIYKALEFHKKYKSEFVYSPKVKSSAQKIFHKKRFEQILNSIDTAVYAPNKTWGANQSYKVFAWDAWNEKQEYKSSLSDNSQNRLLNKIQFKIPDSFTSFRKEAEKYLPNSFKDAIAPSDKDVIARINHYFYNSNYPSSYFDTRNGMVNKDHSSRFSPFLSCGTLDVKYLYNEIKSYEIKNGSNKSTYWLIFELLWREFFYWHYQKWQRAYFSENGIKGSFSFCKINKNSIEDLKKLSTHKFWQASLCELKESGFQTNRTRQLFASFWIHELKLNWRAGAKLFEENLIDYDVYSNWGNWMYLAGVGTDSRGSRRFNIENQLKNYDPEGSYFKKWLNK